MPHAHPEPCRVCRRNKATIAYADAELGAARGKFIRRQNAATHAALVGAKDHYKEQVAEHERHLVDDHAEGAA